MTSATAAATPRAAPTAPASRLYAMPSETNDCTRLPRCAPTARAIPISGFRSAASITKIMKMSMTPDAMEKRPSTRKKVVKMLPNSSAWWTASFLKVSTLMFRVPVPRASRPAGLET